MKATYSVTVQGSERLRFAADFAEASSPIMLVDDDGTMRPTVYQVADARHDYGEAADMLNDWLRGQGGEAWGEDEHATVRCLSSGTRLRAGRPRVHHCPDCQIDVPQVGDQGERVDCPQCGRDITDY